MPERGWSRLSRICGVSRSYWQPRRRTWKARAETLSEYATRFRYPGARYEPSLEEARVAAALARELMEAILIRLPREVRP